MSRILITGGSGFIGHSTIPLIEDLGWEIHCVTRRAHKASGTVQWHRLDLMDGRATAKLLAEIKPTHLLHLAWYTEPRRYLTADENKGWIDASVALVDAFAAAGGTHAVVAGTCMEYDLTDGICREDSTPLKPTTLYGKCKLALHDKLREIDASMTVGWGRVFHLYGPHEAPARLVASVSRAVLKGREARISDGRQQRDYLHVSDVAKALSRMVTLNESVTVNIGSGAAVEVREIARQIGKLSGRPDLIKVGSLPPAPTDVPLVQADTTLIRRLLGWSPSIDLETGLKDALSFWAEREPG